MCLLGVHACVCQVCVQFVYLFECVGVQGRGLKAEQPQGSGKRKSLQTVGQLYYGGRGLCCGVCGGLALGQFCHGWFFVLACLLLQARWVTDTFKNNKMSTEVWIPQRFRVYVQVGCLDSVCETGLCSQQPLRAFQKNECCLSISFYLSVCWSEDSTCVTTAFTTAPAVSGCILVWNTRFFEKL